jgi:hypothetical protein
MQVKTEVLPMGDRHEPAPCAVSVTVSPRSVDRRREAEM